MRDLLIATTNPGKFNQLRDVLQPLNLALTGLSDYPGSIRIAVEENEKTAQKNAQMKAKIYALRLNVTTLAMDNGLYLAGLPDEFQPGIYVRRIYGESPSRPSDQELLAYYTGLIKGLGGKVDGHWEFAVCIATPAGQVFETTIITPRSFVSKPTSKLISGYPLESLQIDPKTGKYIAEMSVEEKALFWQQLMSKRLCPFVQTTLRGLSAWMVGQTG